MVVLCLDKCFQWLVTVCSFTVSGETHRCSTLVACPSMHNAVICHFDELPT
jgi:hypothetical protein